MIVDLSRYNGGTVARPRMVACPLCDAKAGREYRCFSNHLHNEHTWSDLGLGPDPFADVQGQPVATDGGRDQEVRG